MAIDLNDPRIQYLLSLYLHDNIPPNIRYTGAQNVRPVMELEHIGDLHGTDVFSSCLRLVVSTAGTAAEGIVISGGTTIGNLIRVFNQPENTVDYTTNTFVVSSDGRMGIMTPIADVIDGRLEIDQYDNTPVIVVKAFLTGTQDLLQFFSDTGIKVTWVTQSGELHTDKNAFFNGPDGLQVGGHTADYANVDGVAISLKNLASAPFTGAPTTGINIVATDGRLRYIDPSGNVWRLPDGNPLPELHGLKSWNYDPTNATGAAAPTAGVIYLMKTLFHRSVQASTIRWQVTNNAAMPTNTYFGIYDLAGNRLCITADVSSDMTTIGTKSAAMISPPVMPPNYYYIAFLVGGYAGGGPQLSIAGVPAGIANANLAAPDLRFASYSSGLTALPATITMASQVSSANQFWVGTA